MTKASLSHKGKMQKNCYSKLSSTKKSLKGLRSSIDQLETHIHSLADRLEGETAKTDGEWRSAITDFVNFYSELGFTKFRELPILDDASLQEEEEEENGHLNYYDETDEAAVPKEEHESVWTEFISTYYKGCVAPIVDFFGIWKESQKTPLVHSKEALDRATKALEGVEREIIETEREVENIERKSGIDYGALGEFFGLDDQCFESEGSGEYIYEICPFKEAKQKKADTKALVASLG